MELYRALGIFSFSCMRVPTMMQSGTLLVCGNEFRYPFRVVLAVRVHADHRGISFINRPLKEHLEGIAFTLILSDGNDLRPRFRSYISSPIRRAIVGNYDSGDVFQCAAHDIAHGFGCIECGDYDTDIR